MPTTQRWERPFDFPPGHWKKQLPTKYLAVGARGDLDALRRLLADHPEFLNKGGGHGRTLLWEAVRMGRLSAVRRLVEQGAEKDATGAYNSESYVQITPYCAAIYYKRPDVEAYLLSQTPVLDIFRAAFLGRQAQVAAELAAQPDLLNAEDPHDAIYFTPLLAFAVAGGHLPMVEDLLKAGAEVTRYSGQLLNLAARASRMDLIERLVAYGAEVESVDGGIVGVISDLSIARYLLDHGASADQTSKNRQPPLTYVVRGDKGEHPEKAQLLLDYGAAVNAITPNGKTALHYAAKAGFLTIVTLLLEHGANPDLRDEDGETALSLAQTAGKTEVAALLKRR